MSQLLERVISEESRQRLLLAVAFPSAREVGIRAAAAEAGMSVADAVYLLNEPAFIAQIRQITFAEASAALHGRGVADLVAIATESEEDRNRLTAWRVIAQITGDLKHKHQHEVRVTFEDLRKRRGDGDLAGLFDIRANVIEGELCRDSEKDL
jgi:hypothetical protein